MSKAHNFRAAPFPFGAWVKTAQEIAFHPTDHLPVDWSRHVKLNPPPSADLIEEECRAVLAAKAKRPRRLDAIVREAEYIGLPIAVVEPALDLAEFLASPSLQRLIQQALYDLEVGVFRLKMMFNRGRPYHCCDLPLDPVFPLGTDLYPGHPSYPSGHSAAAHSVALLVSEFAPDKKKQMWKAADQVARNREIAGLHFRSDSEAGAELARQFVEMLWASETFKVRRNAARAEWDARVGRG